MDRRSLELGFAKVDNQWVSLLQKRATKSTMDETAIPRRNNILLVVFRVLDDDC